MAPIMHAPLPAVIAPPPTQQRPTRRGRGRAKKNSADQASKPKRKYVEAPAKCLECGKMFSRKGNMLIHVENVHRKIKRWQCRHCGRRFAAKSVAAKHQNESCVNKVTQSGEVDAAVAAALVVAAPDQLEPLRVNEVAMGQIVVDEDAVNAAAVGGIEYPPEAF